MLVDGVAHHPAGVLAQLGALPAAVGAGEEIGVTVFYFYHPQGGAKGGFFGNKGRIVLFIECKKDLEAHRLIFCT